jgi:uncharacterized protein with HEPN domain
MRRDSERISDIIEACALVAGYIEVRTLADSVSNSLFRDAVVRQLTIVGEAAQTCLSLIQYSVQSRRMNFPRRTSDHIRSLWRT